MKRASTARLWALAIRLTGMLLLISGASLAADGGPAAARKALATDGQMILSPSDRCPVCAMFPARHPQTAAAMTLIDNKTFYFCSNGCLFRTWLRPRVYLGQPREAIERLVTRDYFSGRPIDARSATWVAGSDVIGPMGPAIIALDDAGQLAVFKNRHGGTIVFTFSQVDDLLWKQISRRELPAPEPE